MSTPALPPRTHVPPSPTAGGSQVVPSNVTTTVMPPPPFSSSVLHSRANWKLYQYWIRYEWDECVKCSHSILQTTSGKSEFALYCIATISLQYGKIKEALEYYQTLILLYPNTFLYLKQVGKCLFLMGKHRQALEIYEEANKLGVNDWDLWHQQGECYTLLKDHASAFRCYSTANSISRHEKTYLSIGKILASENRIDEAIENYLESIEFSPNSPDLTLQLSLLYLQKGENYRAFDYLGNNLTIHCYHAKSLLAIGSILQDFHENDIALIKYRILIHFYMNSSSLWNNIGMCFYGKQRWIAAISCLKKSLSYSPFEWILYYNLGLSHLITSQFASAFHYLSAAINLNPYFASSYMYLGLTLAHLDDYENATHAYEKALSLDKDFLFYLNYCISCVNQGEYEKAKRLLDDCKKCYSDTEDDQKQNDSDILEMMKKLEESLKQKGA